MRFSRHLSFSNVIAVIALFVALGGAAYASNKINGKKIVKGSIGGGKLKNETVAAKKIKNRTITAKKIKKGTITSAEIKDGSISSEAIDLSTLGMVPSAQTANTATNAGKAESATTANTATSANTAKHAEEATIAGRAIEADSAKLAQEAMRAKSAEEADSAKHAEEADRATSAADADTVGGETAAELTVSCPARTEFYGGMCWDEATRPHHIWVFAVTECGNEGGRLPSIAELIAFVSRPGNQVTEQTWSGDVDALGPGGEPVVLTSDEAERKTETSGPLGYRCVFYRSN